jgi:DNA-binding NtrC family response regulator
MRSHLLIVDDDAEMRGLLGSLFSSDGHACELAANAAAALEIVGRQPFDAVICDVLMEGMSGLELLDRVRRTHPALPFIVITGAGGVPQAVDAIKRGAFQYVMKPCDGDRLRAIVTEALEARPKPGAGMRTAAPLPRVADPVLVGSGPAMRALQSTIELVARSRASAERPA